MLTGDGAHNLKVTVAKTAGFDQIWLSSLIEDQPVAPDLSALRCIAGLFGVAEPKIVAAEIRHILERERKKLPS